MGWGGVSKRGVGGGSGGGLAITDLEMAICSIVLVAISIAGLP